MRDKNNEYASKFISFLTSSTILYLYLYCKNFAALNCGLVGLVVNSLPKMTPDFGQSNPMSSLCPHLDDRTTRNSRKCAKIWGQVTFMSPTTSSGKPVLVACAGPVVGTCVQSWPRDDLMRWPTAESSCHSVKFIDIWLGQRRPAAMSLAWSAAVQAPVVITSTAKPSSATIP